MVTTIPPLTGDERTILHDYCSNHFTSYTENPEEDLSFLDFWNSFISDVARDGAEKTINARLIPSLPLTFKNPDSISAEIYESAAGKIPVIKIAETEDFEKLVTNLVHKGKKPQNIGSTGASFVYGKKTRFIILSQKPYSNVSAATMNLSEEDWLKKSLALRLEHECTHFFTKKFYGTAQNHLHDELVADFFGIMAAFGFYRAEYFEYFMGIKGTEGSRLSCYIGDCGPSLLHALKETAKNAASYLEALSKTEDFTCLTHAEKIRRLCELDLSSFLPES